MTLCTNTGCVRVLGALSTFCLLCRRCTVHFVHLCRINTKTGEVKRHCLFAQSNDHPRVNPSFYSRPTRYVYVNMCMTEDSDISNPPMVSSGRAPLPISLGSASPVPEASNVVPAPAFLGKTQQSIPDPVAREAALSGPSGVSWTTESSASSSSLLPTTFMSNSLPVSLHAYAPRDPTPYTDFPLSVGGAPAAPVTLFQQSIATAKDRLSKLSKLSISEALSRFDQPWSQGDQGDFATGTDEAAAGVSSTAEINFEEDAFPVSANKLAGKMSGSTRDMGSLEWLNLCSGPPKANLLLATCLSNYAHTLHALAHLLSVHIACFNLDHNNQQGWLVS